MRNICVTRQMLSCRKGFVVFSCMRNPHSTKNSSHRLKKRVEECAHTQAKQLPKALQLQDVSAQTGHDALDVIKT